MTAALAPSSIHRIDRLQFPARGSGGHPANLIFIRRSSMVLELSLGVFSPKKQENLHRWLKKLSSYISKNIKLLQTYFDIFSTFELRNQVHIFNSSPAQLGGIQPEETGKSKPLVKKRQISSYCRHILTFPAHLIFVSRSTSSMVPEPRSEASSQKKNREIFTVG